jgi:hypothetical protein
VSTGPGLNTEHAQNERRLLAFPEREVGNDAVAVKPQRHGRRKAKIQPWSVEADAVRAEVAMVHGAGVVERRPAFQVERQFASHHAYPSDKLGQPCAPVAHRHVVLHFTTPSACRNRVTRMAVSGQ